MKVLCLLSGGIDSPVAAYRMIKSGYELDYIFFYNAPYMREQELDIAINCIKKIKENLAIKEKVKLFIVKNSALMSACMSSGSLQYLIHRRLMFRIASELAKKENYSALVTGESLAQVASQTLDNIAAITPVSTLPILRPLLGFDKQETINIAENIGTFQYSKEHNDCGLGIIKQARTSVKQEELDEIEKSLNIPQLVKETLDKLEILKM